MRAALGLGLLLGLGAAPEAMRSHEALPLHVEMREEAPAEFRVRWRAPGTLPDFNRPSVELPAGCVESAPTRLRGATGERRARCPDGLDGARLRVAYPVFNPSVTTLIRLERLSGETHTAVLAPDRREWTVPDRETAGGVARQYIRLGVTHIAGGADHLLFVACLLFVAGSLGRILWTVTGFTLAHSVTLALSTLGLVRVPVPPVEAAIALSILLLAVEIARGRRDTLTWRRPIAVSSSFGLLHGFGFASVLHEIGLPQTELPTALLFFNLGVELGQLAFIAALALAFVLLRAGLSAWRHLPPAAWLERTRLPVAYGVGVVSSYWLVDRVAGF